LNIFGATTASLLLCSAPAVFAQCGEPEGPDTAPRCNKLEEITIFGTAVQARDVAGGASVVSAMDLEAFDTTDIVRALRRVPGVSLQIEDGWALRPNISIRGTATERSSRVTLMEDSVLIAPAPYAAPSAYYFPTFGRINSVQVLKGPSSITQGPYTVGGALNLVSTPVPESSQGFLQTEGGSDSTWRVHGWYGGGSERARYLVETHQWNSDGYQSIDRSNADTGFSKQDYLAKLSFSSGPDARIRQQLDVKLQYSEETSQQSYLGLTDRDFENDALRRYGASLNDEMDNNHDQVVVTWRLESPGGAGFSVTGYNNNTERAWYKTEGVDFDGSDNPQAFRSTSWASVVDAINRGQSLAGVSAERMQAILDGADTAEGAIQLRNNAREYYSRGIQLVFDQAFEIGSTEHSLEAGLRYHRDQEDRLQRNDNYQQLSGQLILNESGLEGNAGNRIQDAEAWAAYVYDRVDWGRWTFTPGLRYENIVLSRTRYRTDSQDPSSRSPDNYRDSRENRVAIWLPGIGSIYELSPSTRLVGGIHKGFATPTNEPDVNPEESINYELGLRHDSDRYNFEAMFFFNDYDNLVGVCTNSSGSDCEPGDAFNGQGVHVPGLELSFQTRFDVADNWEMPLQAVYTWMNAKFQSEFDSEFFGHVYPGDPVPYVPRNQAWASLGMLGGPWSFYLSGNYVGSVCTRASCDSYQETESAVVFDLAAHYRLNRNWEIYGLVENVADHLYIAAREPYGVRVNKPRTFMLGAKFDFTL
jgi:Fe(3+) dicitrate transport protein